MIADFDDFCTWMYVIISDLLLRWLRRLRALVQRRFAPMRVDHSGDCRRMLRLGSRNRLAQPMAGSTRHLFPHQPERSRFNRRRRDLAK